MKKNLKRLILALAFPVVGAINLILSPWALAQKLPEKFEIPKKYENYRSGNPLPHYNFDLAGLMVHNHRWDINNDGLKDVSELYRVMGFDEMGNTLIPDHPLIYGFDINGNQQFELDEILYDEAMDGLNGNEVWMGKKVPNVKTLAYGI